MFQSRPSIHNSTQILSLSFTQLHQILSNSQKFLEAAHVYPLSSFPGRTQGQLLEQLTRKKLQPSVENWIDEGVRHAAPFTASSDKPQTNGTAAHDGERAGLNDKQLKELWDSARYDANRIAKEVLYDTVENAIDDVFTLEEHEMGIENVVTGLRRKLWDDEDEDENEEGEKEDKGEAMDVDAPQKEPSEVVKNMARNDVEESRPMMSLENLLRFVCGSKEP